MQKTNFFVRAFRMARVALHICTGLTIAGGAWPFLNQQRKHMLTKWWCRRLLRCFNIQIITHGALPNANTKGTMFVANHISWMDIHAINSVLPLQFIAKSEVSNWPVFGYLVRKSGTVFIDRGRRKDALRIIEIASNHLKNGVNIGFFPEGTTTDGTHLVKFKSSIIQSAIDADATLWPIALHYPLAGGGANTQMAYAGETTMAESIWQVLNQKNPVVELHFLAPMPAQKAERQALCEAAFTVISTKLGL